MDISQLKKDGKFYRSHTAEKLGYSNYKDIKFQYINGIHIDKFRSFTNRDLHLGKYLTLITGKNGTMKSSVLGLIAHPFSSPNNARDMYGKELKTLHSDVFRLSLEKDQAEYIYYLDATTIKGENIFEPVRIYRRDNRHRLTVGVSNEKGQGNFALNTSYINLIRLYPMIETKAKSADIDLSEDDMRWISESYEKIMQRTAYVKPETVSDKHNKNTLAPTDSYYDFNSISSGEDNLGHILCKMLAFMKYKQPEDALQGLLCIDEIEASLHPSAQRQFIDFLYNWSVKNHIQVIMTTHSLYIINHCLKIQSDYPEGVNDVVINNISTQQVGDDHNFNIMVNPDFNTMYKELTYTDADSPSIYKVNIICEDDIAKKMIKAILKKSSRLSNIDFITDITGSEGSSYNQLLSLSRNGKKLLADSIIIVDPDVDLSLHKNIDPDYLIAIPSPDEHLWAIERRVVTYLYNLDGASDLFYSKEKDAVIADFNSLNITQHTLNEDNLKIDSFKTWVKNNKQLFNKALTQYIKDNKEIFDPFSENLLRLINLRRQTKGLPPLK